MPFLETASEQASIKQLYEGFEALLDKAEHLLAHNQALEKQIRQLKTQESVEVEATNGTVSTTSSGPLTPVLSTSSWRDAAYDIQSGNLVNGERWWTQDDRINRGVQAFHTIASAVRNNERDTMDSRSHSEAVSRKYLRQLRRPMSISKPPNFDEVPFEQDFTTLGRVGDLSCPFQTVLAEKKEQAVIKMDQSQPPTSPQPLSTPPALKEEIMSDPIAAEFHPDLVKSHSPPSSVEGASKCPIRYLDQHSPEEVAKYFENHKHEIPRSHEVCVKRYQTNEESIRELDAKYGSLVNMLQGLGVKHKPMLPSKEEEEAAASERKSIERVTQWADQISTGPVEDAASEADGSRVGHFERPLQDVRLGESPSRPWGIQVPLEHQLEANVTSPKEKEAAAPVLPPDHPHVVGANGHPVGATCPFGFMSKSNEDAAGIATPKAVAPPVATPVTAPIVAPEKPVEPAPKAEMPEVSSKKIMNTNNGTVIFTGPVFFMDPRLSAASHLENSQHKTTFTGPVFFGYTAEAVQKLLNEFQNPYLI